MSQPKLKEERNIEYLRAPTARDIGSCAALLLTARASALGLFPFGIAFFAACLDKSIAYIGITLITVALLSASAGSLIVKYLIASLLYWIYTRFRRGERLNIDAIVCGACVLAGGAAYLVYNYTGAYDVLMLLAEAAVSGIMYIVFKKAGGLMHRRARGGYSSNEELISAAIMAGVMIMGLDGIVFPYGIGLADVVSVYAVLSIAMCGSIGASGSGGLCIGFMTGIGGANAVEMMGMYGMSALLANLLKGFGRIGIVLGFLIGSAAAMLFVSEGALPTSMLEITIGAALFLITPKKISSYISGFFENSLHLETVGSDARVKEYLSMRLTRMSNGFRELEEAFEDAADKRLKTYSKDVSKIIDETADRVCVSCPNAAKCWQDNFTATYRSVMQLLEQIETGGGLNELNAPAVFRERCVREEVFITEINHSYELYRKSLMRRGDAKRNQSAAARQYREISRMLDFMASDINEGFMFRCDLEEKIVAALAREGIITFEISVVEGERGKIEVYLGISTAAEIEEIEDALYGAIEIPMGYDGDAPGGIMRFVSKPRYSADVALRQINRDYSAVSGDSADAFITEDYKQYVIISDGMGSGRRAKTESRITLKLLREFLLAGFSVRTAVDMLNSAMCIKLDGECFATVDLFCADLMSGVCEFYKIGAAESVILRGENVETVFSASLPSGISPEIHPSAQIRRFEDGDTAVMISDGISEAGFGTIRTDWIKKEIKKPYDTMDDLALAVAENAVKKSRGAVVDDMTVAAIRLIENG